MNGNLAEQLKSYSKKDYYPFHMPGHKRNPFSVNYEPSIETDITEIEDFDNLHHAEGILMEAQMRASKLYGTKETFYSVNGSTAALLSAVSACTTIGGTILMGRNCHKAVYHAVYLRQLNPVYVYPEWEGQYGLNGGIDPQKVKKLLQENTKIQAVLVTSPTYDGMVSDIEEISKLCRERNLPLIVDEAHGAHFPFHQYFPDSAITKGADLVIQSLHKTLPSMTQTALLHRCSDVVSSESIHRYMGIYQSSSPSYPMMASMDSCICRLMDRGQEEFQCYVEQLKLFHHRIADCGKLRSVNPSVVGKSAVYDWDPSKIVLMADPDVLTGRQLYLTLLHEYHLQMEMEAPGYVLGITSVADTKEGFERLWKAVSEIDAQLESSKKTDIRRVDPLPEMKKVKNIQEAMDQKKEYVSLESAKNRVSGEFLSLYPPGIPLIVPGECMSVECIEYVENCIAQGFEVHGLNSVGKVGVVYE